MPSVLHSISVETSNTYNMKYILTCLFYFCLGIFQNCSSPKGNLKVENEKVIFVNDTTIYGSKYAAYVFADTIPVYATLEVSMISIDSVPTKITLFNEYKQDLLLYEPILPSDSLAEKNFIIMDEDDNSLPHVNAVTNHKYLDNNPDVFPIVIPEVVENKFVKLRSGDSLVFNVNLAKQYDFKSLKTKRRDFFYIGYASFFPLIENGRHVQVKNQNNDLRPFYFVISSNNRFTNLDRIKVKIP
jgi:hypothetical protein